MLASAVIVSIPLLIILADACRWPFVHDAPLLHYIVFLMGKGFAPYRDIVDMNMPSAYMLERMGIWAFGGGAVGWFLCDLAATAASVKPPAILYCLIALGPLGCIQQLLIAALSFGRGVFTSAICRGLSHLSSEVRCLPALVLRAIDFEAELDFAVNAPLQETLSRSPSPSFPASA